MKISELARTAGVPKETIHFYIREGLLPKPRKRGKNAADYEPSFADRIRLIKTLQDRLYLPLSKIKEILGKSQDEQRRAVLTIRSEYFNPDEQLTDSKGVDEAFWMKATGLNEEWRSRLEEWGLITPGTRDGEKVYSRDDVTIGRLVADMGLAGMGPEDGFDPESLKYYNTMFRKIVRMAVGYYFEALWGKVPMEDFLHRSVMGREIMGLFFYQFFRKLSLEEFESLLTEKMESVSEPE